MKQIYIFFVFLACVATGTIYASVAIQLSNKEMTEKADEIVIGTVKEISYVFDEKQRTPYTITTIVVEKWIKGNSKEREIKVRQIGGKFGNQQLFITGDARLTPQEKVLLFLTKGEEFRFVLALSQAKFSIVKDEKTQEEKVIRDVSQLSLGKFDKEGKLVIEKAPSEKSMLLKDLVKEIESYIKK